LTLSDDLTLPLLQVKSSIELLQSNDFSKKASRRHAVESALNIEAGLQLVEAYRLLLGYADITSLPLEPIAVGALLEDIAHKLEPYARQYQTDIEVSVQHRLAPVIVHQASLYSAIEVLSSSLIRAQAGQTDEKDFRIVLGAHRSIDNSIAAGVFGSVHGISDKTLRAARSLVGRARQPLPSVPAGAAAGVLVADMLCSAFWQPLRSAAHDNLAGLATNIPASKQLQFV
jgi:light-regulated signal transduction histidine kinase (bacteriophytochrome)